MSRVPVLPDEQRRIEMLLENKNAVIYGTGGAIGGAFAREEARVFLTGRTLAGVEALAGEISAARRVAEAAQVGAPDEQAVEKRVGGVTERAGSIDALFNAIGMEDIQGTALGREPHDFADYAQETTAPGGRDGK